MMMVMMMMIGPGRSLGPSSVRIGAQPTRINLSFGQKIYFTQSPLDLPLINGLVGNPDLAAWDLAPGGMMACDCRERL